VQGVGDGDVLAGILVLVWVELIGVGVGVRAKEGV
jgi:hypothetical protein